MRIPTPIMVVGISLCVLAIPFWIAGAWLIGPATISWVADRLDHG